MKRQVTFLGALLALAVSANLAANLAATHNFTNLNKPIPDGNLAGMSDRHSLT